MFSCQQRTVQLTDELSPLYIKPTSESEVQSSEQNLMWTNEELASPFSVQSEFRCSYWLTFSKIVREGYDILQNTIIISMSPP